MNAVIASLVPVIGLIGLGYLLRRTLVPGEAEWNGIEKLAYFVLFPALIVETLARADLSSVPVAGIGGALALSIILLASGLIASAGAMMRALAISGPAFSSVFQGATRWNTFIALSLAGALYGRPGVTAASVAMIAMIPLLNVLAVLVLSRYGAGKPPALAGTLKALATNPLILACIVGLAINLTGLPVPGPVWAFAETLGRASLALGLLLVGAGLVVDSTTRLGSPLWLSTILKLAVMPALALTLAWAFGVSGTELVVVAICAAVPTASNAYVLARQLGGHAPLMAQIITVQTLIAAGTLPVAILVAEWIG
jgi:hypothetical protein